MKNRCFAECALISIILIVSITMPGLTSAREVEQEWELINPEGTMAIKIAQPASRPDRIDGKTIVLRWNSKHNGDNFLNRIAELLAEKVPSAKVIKLYEVDKSTVKTSGSNAESARIAKVIKDLKADIVIGSQAD
jgi:hypothetical protein